VLGAGAPAAQREATGVPIQDYYNLNVGEIVEQFGHLLPMSCDHVRAYEQQNKNRDTLLGQIDRRIKAAS
jgi:hypothetical protein